MIHVVGFLDRLRILSNSEHQFYFYFVHFFRFLIRFGSVRFVLPCLLSLIFFHLVLLLIRLPQHATKCLPPPVLVGTDVIFGPSTDPAECIIAADEA